MTFLMPPQMLSSENKISPKPSYFPSGHSLHPRVQVTFDYAVHFTTGCLRPDNPLLANVLTNSMHVSRVLFVVDSGLLNSRSTLLEEIIAYSTYYRDRLILTAQPLVVPNGEAAKNDPELVTQIQTAISDGKLCRHSYVVAIGGGAVLDLVGYATATAHRGVRLIRIPTTVLAQNDSGVGVKTSVNAFGKKNFLGTFTPPTAVINDAEFLQTLGDRDWRSGIAEAVKVALIKDRTFFEWIQTHAQKLSDRDLPTMQHLIYRCCELHLDHITHGGDPFETGSSRPLDFGHWAAHRLEHLTQYQLRHGEAVAIGIALDCTYAHLMGWLARSPWQQIIDTLKALGFEIFVPALKQFADQPQHPESIFQGLTEFREHLGGELTLLLLNDIAAGFEVHQVECAVYQKAIRVLEEMS